MSTAKPQPPSITCPHCGQTIGYTLCNVCHGTGEWAWDLLDLPKQFCGFCNGEGWKQEPHILCSPGFKTSAESGGIPGWDWKPTPGPFPHIRTPDPTPTIFPPYTPPPRQSPVPGGGTSGPSGDKRPQPINPAEDSNSHIGLILALMLLVVGVVFIPELRELVRIILVAVWSLLMEGIGWLTDLLRSVFGS